jgi:outer membrane receptor for ferrienterochelin and colicin
MQYDGAYIPKHPAFLASIERESCYVEKLMDRPNFGRDEVAPGLFSTFVPESRTMEWANLFIQDEFEITRNVKATLGMKLEHNDYTGLEYLPIELWAFYEIMPEWRISTGGARFNNELRIKPGSNAVGINDILANDPKYQFQLRSSWQAFNKSLLEISLRHVADLSHQDIPSYTAVDANYIWQVDKQLEFSITAQNLTDNSHQEFGNADSVNEFQRMIWLAVSWKY